MLYPPSTMAGEPLQLAPPPPPLATMDWVTVMGAPVVRLCRLAPNAELLPDSVDCLMVAVPKLPMAPPPLLPAVLPVKVLLLMFTVASLSIAPPPGPVFPVNVLPVTVKVPTTLTIAPPPKSVAVLPLKVVSVTEAVFWVRIPPPSWPELPLKVLSDTDSGPLASIAPPDVPVAAGAELPLNVVCNTVSGPWLKMAPPPLVPSLARPLLSVTLLTDRLPPEATSSRRKAAVPDRVMVAPLPAMLTWPVMTGRPLPPSVALSAAVSE